jgi:hypothetical protein
MNEPSKKKPVPRKPVNKKPLPPVKHKQDDSDDIERAVYDGMQDLRADKPK